jgi:hypothetical protein
LFLFSLISSNNFHLSPGCQASCTSQRNQKSELMIRARQSTYTVTTPLTCDMEDKSKHASTTEERLHANLTYDSRGLYVDTEGGYQQFFNTLALIPCQVSCTSQRNQKSELMERGRPILIYCNTGSNTMSCRVCVVDLDHPPSYTGSNTNVVMLLPNGLTSSISTNDQLQ